MLLVNVEELFNKEKLTYEEMHQAFAALYKLTYNPVAVKFIFDQAEYDNLVVDKVPGPKMTFCQVMLASRMDDYIVKVDAKKILCDNAQISFGFKEPGDKEIQDHMKYVNDWDFAKECMLSKPRLPADELKGIVTAPLYKTPMDPDLVLFIVDTFQAYHILNDYIGAVKESAVSSTHMINSAICAGSVGCFQSGKASMTTMCAGSYSSGKTERGEINVFIPGKAIEAVAKQLISRSHQYRGGASFIGAGGQEYPGVDVCKKCPMIKFRDYEK